MELLVVDKRCGRRLARRLRNVYPRDLGGVDRSNDPRRRAGDILVGGRCRRDRISPNGLEVAPLLILLLYVNVCGLFSKRYEDEFARSAAPHLQARGLSGLTALDFLDDVVGCCNRFAVDLLNDVAR